MSRKRKPSVYYWDMTLLGKYWNCFNSPRIYHHTVCANLIYGLREALAQLIEKGLQASWVRHSEVTKNFHEKLQKRGYKFFVPEEKYRLNTVTALILPGNVDGSKLTRNSLEK